MKEEFCDDCEATYVEETATAPTLMTRIRLCPRHSLTEQLAEALRETIRLLNVNCNDVGVGYYASESATLEEYDAATSSQE